MLICVPVVIFVLAALAAIAIPTFLNERNKAAAAATTVTLPDAVDGLERLRTAEADATIEAQLNSLPTDLLKDAQGAAYSDGDTHTVWVQVARFNRVVNPSDVDEAIVGFQKGVASDLPPGVTATERQDRPSGPLGGRISCTTLSGETTGQICVAVDSATMLVVVDVAPSSSIDPDLPRRVREAVVHRTQR